MFLIVPSLQCIWVEFRSRNGNRIEKRDRYRLTDGLTESRMNAWVTMLFTVFALHQRRASLFVAGSSVHFVVCSCSTLDIHLFRGQSQWVFYFSCFVLFCFVYSLSVRVFFSMIVKFNDQIVINRYNGNTTRLRIVLLSGSSRTVWHQSDNIQSLFGRDI